MKRNNKKFRQVYLGKTVIGTVWRSGDFFECEVSRTGNTYGAIDSKKDAIKLVKDLHLGR